MQNILKSKIFIAIAFMMAAIAAAAVISVNTGYSGKDLQMQLDLGNKYVSELDYENAIIAYEEALEIDPYCLEAYLGLSDAYLALGQEDKAIEIMEQAKGLLPDNEEIYVSLAQLYASQDQISLAVSILEEGIQATGSDRLKAMLDEYHPGKTQTELADNDSRDASGQKTEEPSAGIPEDAAISVGIRQEIEPVIVVSREDEEMVTIPLIVPVPGNNGFDDNSQSGGEEHGGSNISNGSSNISGGVEDSGIPGSGEEDDSSIPDMGNEDDNDIPDIGNEDDNNIPDTGDENDNNNSDTGDEDDNNIPDTGDENDNNIPDAGDVDDGSASGGDSGNGNDVPGTGDDCDTPAAGDGGNDTPGTVIPIPPRTGIAGNVYGVHGQGIEGVTVTVYSSQNEVIVAADTDTIGSYLQELQSGDYRIVLSKEGYMELSTSVSVVDDVLTSNSYIMLTEEESLQSASLKGVVISAVDSAAVEGATVALLNGFDNASYNDPNVIEGSTHTTTGASGEFSMESGVNAGYYTVVTSKDNYSTYHHNETVKPGENEFQISMSPLIRNQGVYRIVLTWGSAPRDLDSHITSTGNDNYHVYYANRDSGDGKAVLDRDVTYSYGPETITLEIGSGNSYIYSVYNFTNGGAAEGTAEAWNLANSGANVKVYGDEGMIFDGNVPTNEQGVTWEVFRIENGRLTVTNKVLFDHPSNLPQIDSAGENSDMTAETVPAEDSDMTAEMVSAEDGRNTVLQTVTEAGGQMVESATLTEENMGTEEAEFEENRSEETAETEETKNVEIQESAESETVNGEIPPELEEEDAEEETADTEEAAGTGETALPEEPADTDEALKPEEEISIEEIPESGEMKAEEAEKAPVSEEQEGTAKDMDGEVTEEG